MPQPETLTQMPEPGSAPSLEGWSGTVTAWDGAGRPCAAEDRVPAVIVICEHASNAVAAGWPALARDTAALQGHAGHDPGALGLARALGPHLARRSGPVELIHAPLSRLVYDLNRSPDRRDAMPDRIETFSISANADLDAQDRLARMRQVYLPFHALVRARVARALVLGLRPAILTLHSFTPVWHGVPRAVEFGIIHDDLPDLALAILAGAGDLGLVTRLNEPYSAADHVTHTLRLHALPYGLPNAMLELRNDLIATPAQQEDMAARLAPVLSRAMAQVTERETAQGPEAACPDR